MKKEKGWFYTEITTNAKRYASEAIESTALTNGYYTDSLERELKDFKYSILRIREQWNVLLWQ